MTSPLRCIPDDVQAWTDRHGDEIAVVEITIRALQSRFLLLPTETCRARVLGVIGKAQAALDFEIFGYAVMSNHMSMLVGVRDAKHQGAIMEYIHGNIAREIGHKDMHNWSGHFWGRRGRPITCLDDATLIARLRYTIANSTKEDLVEHPTLWPGAHCAKILCEGEATDGRWCEEGEWIDRTGLFHRRRRADGDKITEADFTETVHVYISKLPCWRHLSDAEYQAEINRMCDEIAEEAEKERARTGKTVLGVEALLSFDPHHCPDHTDRSPAPLVHAATSAAAKVFKTAYGTFVDAYHAAFDALRACTGTLDDFPAGGIPPGTRWSPA